MKNVSATFSRTRVSPCHAAEGSFPVKHKTLVAPDHRNMNIPVHSHHFRRISGSRDQGPTDPATLSKVRAGSRWFPFSSEDDEKNRSFRGHFAHLFSPCIRVYETSTRNAAVIDDHLLNLVRIAFQSGTTFLVNFAFTLAAINTRTMQQHKNQEK